MDNHIKNHRLKNVVGENAGESQKFLRLGSDDAENEIGMLQHDPHIGQRPARRPPFVLKEGMQLPDL